MEYVFYGWCAPLRTRSVSTYLRIGNMPVTYWIIVSIFHSAYFLFSSYCATFDICDRLVPHRTTWNFPARPLFIPCFHLLVGIEMQQWNNGACDAAKRIPLNFIINIYMKNVYRMMRSSMIKWGESINKERKHECSTRHAHTHQDSHQLHHFIIYFPLLENKLISH